MIAIDKPFSIRATAPAFWIVEHRSGAIIHGTNQYESAAELCNALNQAYATAILGSAA